MNKAVIKSILFLAILLGLTLPTHAAPTYVIDDINAYIHAGPGTNYRIIGAVTAGSLVELKSKAKTKGYQKIKTGKKTGWIKSELLSSSPGLAYKLEQTQEVLVKSQSKVQALNKKLASINADHQADIKNKETLIAQLKTQSKELTIELASAQESAAILQGKLDNLDQSTKMHWLAYGGGLALIFLILGWMIPYLPKKQKKDARWM